MLKSYQNGLFGVSSRPTVSSYSRESPAIWVLESQEDQQRMQQGYFTPTFRDLKLQEADYFANTHHALIATSVKNALMILQ